MAETVGFHVERTIPELEQIRRLNLCTQDEISTIIKKRKDLEHKLERSEKVLNDYMEYINFEVELIKTIKSRRDKFRVFEKKDDIEYSITKRITKLYRMALVYFKSDVNLWMSYINYCTQTRFLNVVTEAYKQMVNVHGDKVWVWRKAAKWELSEMKNTEGALVILRNGIHHHPESKELYIEAFSLELQSALPRDKTAEDAGDRKEKAAIRAQVHFETSLNRIGNDVDYMISLLDIATQYDFTEKLQQKISEHLLTNCWKSELMWYTMAQRELAGHHYDKDANANKNCTSLCLSVFKAAIEIVPTAKMYEYYIDNLADLYKKKSSLKSTLKEVLIEGEKAGKLLEKHYKLWVDLQDDRHKQLEILVSATAAHPEAVNLWISRLQMHISLNQNSEVSTISQEAIKTLKENSLPIYKLLIQYHTLFNTEYNEIKTIFEEGIAIDQDPKICLELRPLYLEWVCLTKNLKTAREEYDKIKKHTPHCLQLHKKMIHLEMGRVNGILVTAVRAVHKIACEQFGKNRTDVWFDYIKFERNHSPELVAQIYSDAKNTLIDSLVSTFMSEYALLNASA